MVSVEEAYQIIQSVSLKLNSEQKFLDDVTGRILFEPVHADRDFPPFDRVAMDGIAINTEHFDATRSYPIEGLQAAGTSQSRLQNKNYCIEVMTGAVLPEGTNAVIPYEDIEIQSGVAKLKLNEVRPGMNVHPQGADTRKGDVLVKAHQLISPAEIALFASVGKAHLQVYDFPKTTILSTGDELVEISEKPESHQIRRSNVYALQAAMQAMGWKASSFHLMDNKEHVKEELTKHLNKYDVLIISGGVSKGKFDFIPDALSELGVKKLFHQVTQRPGKPFWFGTTQNGKIVFALPGNPVSTFVCFYKYIKPWMYTQMGLNPQLQTAQLNADVQFNPPLTYFLQVRVINQDGILNANPVSGGGSGDFVNLNEVDGFLELPLSESTFSAGGVYTYIPFR